MGQHRLYVVRNGKTGEIVRVGMSEVSPIVKRSPTGAKLPFHGNYYYPPLNVKPGETAEVVFGNSVEVN